VPKLPTLAIAAAALLLSACRFQSQRAAYAFPPGVAYRLHYGAELQAEAGGAARGYSSASEGAFSFKAAQDTAKGADLAFTVDSLAFRGSDRDSGEDRYMAERLRKYRARLVLSRSGQILSLEEEPALPPIDFSTLNFGRWLLYGLPAFPGEDIGKGSQWTAEQPLLDKFHPGSKVIKNFTATALRKTGDGRLLTAKFTVEVHLEDLDDALAAKGPALTGKGEAIFNLDKGRPVSVDLTVQGDFRIPAPRPAGDTTSAPPPSKPLQLKERLRLNFGD
jgi:hypothetical protein